MIEKKIALFGGTFDPIHLGHTIIACEALDSICAEKIVFIPAKRSPLKGFFPKAGDEDRLRMIELAIVDYANFEVSDFELKKTAPSYTLETVRKFKADFSNKTSIYWLIGSDAVDELPYWYKITELIDQCNIATVYRAGCKTPDFNKFTPVWGPQRTEKLKKNIIQTSLIDISSTEVRKRLAAGMSVTDMLHPAVAEYIQQHNLYKSKPKN